MLEKAKYISVRFETTNKTYTFETTDETIKNGDAVVVETARGIEYAKVVSDPFENPNVDMEIKPIIRKADKEDERQFLRNKEDALEGKKKAQAEADALGLEMNILSAEYTLDRGKITFIYVADDRVDFRELLKVLASMFHCRIDLRQVGTRDKAKMVSGIGVCGRELCCARYISEFGRISINMAKNQLLALNIQKLSGQCGNLMCCLRYEDEAYKELRKDLPKLNAMVEYENEKFRVTSMNVIARNCKLENQNHAIFISLDDLVTKAKYNKPQVQNNNSKPNNNKHKEEKESVSE
ncbi:MAG: regulatory iron-sulfur-containing complex subunit RicT [Erysipelotrichaceae bacterium]|nr:regulatory iron-sulfur-containing complex subunit RicT [Erysipelotrichaceae bacterium]